VASLKQKGDLAELKIAADLIDRGCRISIPFGEDCDYDLIADFSGHLHRIKASCYYCPRVNWSAVGARFPCACDRR
jgi:hypothetical protein